MGKSSTDPPSSTVQFSNQQGLTYSTINIVTILKSIEAIFIKNFLTDFFNKLAIILLFGENLFFIFRLSF